ncbi:MAG TPA: hypothetical protein VGO80_15390 [Solirubrobacteraceae bacterium]|jgi:hypothetical protein|nr:hypothetical protein [Solirubrobacteraceae bacterium]
MSTNRMTTPDDVPLPARRVVASYASHRDAEKAVQYLADSDEAYADDAARMLVGYPLPSRMRVQAPSTVRSGARARRPTPAT